jgi:D-sedoheptulose 7-phosphate isomerase
MNASARHLQETVQIASLIDTAACEACVRELVEVRARGGRLFILGVGGSAANASHAVNDFRKIAGIEAYAPTDNVSELTARTNDEGWASVFAEWLRGSRLTSRDLLLVFSVGGGSLERNVSPNLVEALQLGQQVGCRIIGIVGKDGGYTAKAAHACVLIPTEKTSSRSRLVSREPRSHSANTLAQPSSLVRAVSSDTLSVGA